MEVELTNKAIRQYERFNEPVLSRINDAIDKLELEPPEGDIKELKGRPGVYRVRIGDYRILYTIENSCIVIFKIASRGQVYKKKRSGK
jgi:mRNA interferase RelE/StbE